MISKLLIQCGTFLSIGTIATLKESPGRAGVKLVFILLPDTFMLLILISSSFLTWLTGMPRAPSSIPTSCSWWNTWHTAENIVNNVFLPTWDTTLYLFLPTGNYKLVLILTHRRCKPFIFLAHRRYKPCTNAAPPKIQTLYLLLPTGDTNISLTLEQRRYNPCTKSCQTEINTL